MSAQEELEKEIERGNFIRAAAIAEGIDLSKDELKEIRYKAICQMAGIRNSSGIGELAIRYGFSGSELLRLLKRFYDESNIKGDKKLLEAAYDFQTGKYLSLKEWIDCYFEI